MVAEVFPSVSGTLVNSFRACRRQAWLFSRKIEPDQSHPYLSVGRFINETTFQREKKTIHVENIAVDMIITGENDLLIGEIKKSMRSFTTAEIQLLYYLFTLKQQGVSAKGVLIFPEERRRIPVELTDEKELEIKDLLGRLHSTLALEFPPPVEKIPYCSHCSFREFCFA
ncbi:MAG TPA: CRISPR-associated protein Cas4 [Methanolinea sp.]|nr:CRISPR-associated protein Cas4 [Methanolinea sp.]HQK56082.1 CRISPR-associated protein Cas4 [Methanolinea sp.]